MESPIPSAAEVRELLARLDLNAVRQLAASSGVPFTTLWKLRAGETVNPGIETVRKFWPDLAEPVKEPDSEPNTPPAPAHQAQAAINSVAVKKGANV